MTLPVSIDRERIFVIQVIFLRPEPLLFKQPSHSGHAAPRVPACWAGVMIGSDALPKGSVFWPAAELAKMALRISH